MVVISVSQKRIPEHRRECRQDTYAHLCTVCSQARNAHPALGSSHTECSVIFVRLKRVRSSGLHMSHPLLQTHLPFTTSTSSSSFTLLSHATQLVQHEHLQEHPVHLAHLHALPVDKQRHQESLWRENLQSGGNPPTTTPTEDVMSTRSQKDKQAMKGVARSFGIKHATIEAQVGHQIAFQKVRPKLRQR